MTIIRPRLVDYYNIPVTQEEVDFAIPFLDEDIPLYLDPFLLWRSPSQQDNALHDALINSFNFLGALSNKGRENDAIELLVEISECCEVGLGTGKSKSGLKIGDKLAKKILSLFNSITEINSNGFHHFEVIQLYINGISKDRISDIACNYLKSFMIDFTQNECDKHSIPMVKNENVSIYSTKSNKIILEDVFLPINPEDNQPIILVPKRWLRFSPWINSEDYFKSAFVENGTEDKIEKAKILDYNRQNYDVVKAYISSKERSQSDCKNDPLFKQIPIFSAKKTLNSITNLSTGKIDNADKRFEDYIVRLMSSLLYPHLDFAQEQSRIESGSQIRDLIFYNNCSYPFLAEIYKDYDCKQVVFEMKNVQEVTRDHINQVNRYLADHFGRFGIIVARNKIKKNILQNTVDLWSGQRRCIICLSDEDLELMVDVYESKQRDPIEIIKKKYIEFIRACPS
ncbi:hypothetical protein [Acetobacterium bakii]|uniref:Restriction endonuclease type IV Mrr domain-containing protein n=1 Tax=Acetobacterium bakii TaxID=52689 RepID=A0A0L6TX43_9FIRM|nr:hypothetical protein [Acetobacterium bakii]KNZ40647.1 hypothetical protein AKG39_16390 [Acetobacterium bakii]